MVPGSSYSCKRTVSLAPLLYGVDMQPTVTIKRLGWLAAATIVLGVLIGVGAGLLTLLLYGVEHVLLGYIEGPELPGPFGVPAARRAISVTVGLSIAGIIWYLMRHKTTAVPSVKKAVAGKRMPFWQTIAHVVLQRSRPTRTRRHARATFLRPVPYRGR